MKKIHEAIECYNEAINLVDTYIEAYLARSIAWELTTCLGLAQKDATDAIKIDNKFAPSHIRNAEVHFAKIKAGHSQEFLPCI